ncbi:MAG: biotin--[acetyl-CoA-carboxylase] ligase [Planctomycetes bacterium]|nr:biotin--[acetyl-CoA-carboxylase] ligase [Planctomycetota bacterium]
MHGRRFEHEEVTSTSDVAFQSLADGTARHADVHTARSQTAGRGQRGRVWRQEADAGLALSLVWMPGPPAPSPAGLTMAAGLAVLDACRALGLVGGRLKWPNDVLVGDAKLAGVLVESRGLDPTAPRYVVGVGLNVLQAGFPDELEAERAVTSLRLAGVAAQLPAAREAVAAALCERLASVTADPRGLADDYLTALGLRGERVRVEVGSRALEGRLEGLDPADGLSLATAEGPRRVALEHISALITL